LSIHCSHIHPPKRPVVLAIEAVLPVESLPASETPVGLDVERGESSSGGTVPIGKKIQARLILMNPDFFTRDRNPRVGFGSYPLVLRLNPNSTEVADP
jgi:hypothetical protein